MNNKLEYDIEKRARAGTRATLRAVVCLYLIYMAYLVVKNLGADSPIPVPLGWAIAAVFVGAGLGFGVYTWRRYRRDLEDARLLPPEASETPEPPEEDAP